MKRIAMILAASAALHAHAAPTVADMRDLAQTINSYQDAMTTCQKNPLLAGCADIVDKVLAAHVRGARMYAEYCAAHKPPEYCEAGNTANKLGIEAIKADREKINAAKAALGK